MSLKSTCVTPFVKQIFVTASVTLNTMGHGLVMGFCASALPQLKEQSIQNMDENSGSWIASIIGLALIIGALLAPISMDRLGRRNTNLVSAIVMTSGWACISVATTVEMLLVGRCLNGLSMGVMATVGPVLIGEYTSPKYRGMFLCSISVAILTGVLLIHGTGAVMLWYRTALVSMFISMIDLILILFSPESPSFLAVRGRYDECRKSFHWLRGYGEDEELEKMIKTEMLYNAEKPPQTNSFTKNTQKMLTEALKTLKKREFYVPIVIMLHMYTINEWSGAITLDVYNADIIKVIVGKDANVLLIITSVDIQRIVSTFTAMFVVRKVKRRTIFLTTVSLNILAYLLSAGCIYLNKNGIWHNSIVGVFLIHFHMFTVSVGSMILPNILAGEILPLRYRGIGGTIGVLWFSMNMTINLKTAPNQFATLGLDVSYCIYAGIMLYCLIVSWWLLPETKDRTLQDIEEGFKSFKKRDLSIDHDEEKHLATS